jgi:lysylphosphatidylglycerol synthetase-like protein (DUF2156 family)
MNAALCYKFHGSVAVICGDPLCEPRLYDHILHEFQIEYEVSAEELAFLGMSETFKEFAERQQWSLLNFGIERVINPVTNCILSGACGKRTYAQSRQLLDPNRGGLKLMLYNPDASRDEQIESTLRDIYERWRVSREESTKFQTYLTIMDFRSYPGQMFYLYAVDSSGRMYGFAGLRRLREGRGFHLDPCIEATSAPRGVGDLLLIASMALLKSFRIRSLSLGYEPLIELPEGPRFPKMSDRILRVLYRQAAHALNLEGKRQYHDKFKPDDTQSANLYLIFPTTSLPRLQQLQAVTETVHVNLLHTLKSAFLF